MNRIFLLSTMAILGVAGIKAQVVEDTAPMWGLRAAFDINLPGKWHGQDGFSAKMYKPGCGVTLGGVCNIYLGKNFSLEPGLSLFYDAYRFDDYVVSTDYGVPITDDPNQYKIGLRVPVMLGYDFKVSSQYSICVYTGPELSWAFAGKINYNDDLYDDKLSDNPFDVQRHVDCAWKVGVGFPYKSVLISFDAAFGMTDLIKNDISFRENRLSIGLTYYL